MPHYFGEHVPHEEYGGLTESETDKIANGMWSVREKKKDGHRKTIREGGQPVFEQESVRSPLPIGMLIIDEKRFEITNEHFRELAHSILERLKDEIRMELFTKAIVFRASIRINQVRDPKFAATVDEYVDYSDIGEQMLQECVELGLIGWLRDSYGSSLLDASGISDSVRTHPNIGDPPAKLQEHEAKVTLWKASLASMLVSHAEEVDTELSSCFTILKDRVYKALHDKEYLKGEFINPPKSPE